MAKPPNQAHNGVEEAIDASAHQLVTSMEQRYCILERGQSAPELRYSIPERGQSTPERGHSTSGRGQSAPDHNTSPSGPRTLLSKSFAFPKTETEARRAAKALLDAGPEQHDRGAMPLYSRASSRRPNPYFSNCLNMECCDVSTSAACGDARLYSLFCQRSPRT